MYMCMCVCMYVDTYMLEWLLNYREMLLNSSFSLILYSSVGMSAGIRSAGDSVPETLGSNPAFSSGRRGRV